MLPRDPVILLSYMNLKLRDFYPSLAAFCEDTNEDMKISGCISSVQYI